MKLKTILEDASNYSKYIKKGTKFSIKTKSEDDIYEVIDILKDEILCKVKCISGPHKGKTGYETFSNIIGHKLYKYKK